MINQLKYFFASILFIPLFVNSQELNKTDNQGRKQGRWEKTYPESGTIRYSGQFRDDQPYGTFMYYDFKGNIQTILTYTDKDTANCTMFYPDSTMMARGRYVRQEKDSTWVYYTPDGKIISEEHYVMGMAYGNWRHFYRNGQLMEEKYYEDGFENGPFKQYFASGLVKREATYKNGYIEGDATFYHENGMLRQEGKYQHDAREGIWKTYDNKGNLVDERMYHKGVPEFRESDLEDGDTSNVIRKDRLVPEDFFEDEDVMAIPENNKKQKKDKK